MGGNLSVPDSILFLIFFLDNSTNGDIKELQTNLMQAKEKILEALINKDREKAIALMDKHVRTIGKTLDIKS